jgi:hypothetical protein
MFLRAVTTVLALSVPAASVAEGRSDVLMDLLSRTPAEDIDPQISSFRDMWFADFAAAARAMETQSAAMESPRAASIGAFARASAHGLAEFLGTGLEGGWEPLVGFSPLEVEAQLSWGSGYDTALVLRLAPGAADGVAPALLANGYAEETREGLLVYANAVEDDSTADFGEFPREKMGDPFQGPLGYASRVALDGPVLMQSTNWPDLLTLSGRGAPQGHPDLPALATVLDSPDWGEVELIQATLLPHQLDLGGPGSGGIPAWDLGLLADLGSGTEAVGLVLFTYRHAADARDAAKSIAKAWDAARPGTSWNGCCRSPARSFPTASTTFPPAAPWPS